METGKKSGERSRNASKVMFIGGSAGSLSAVLALLPLVPAASTLAIVLVFHRKQTEDNVLLDILRTKTQFIVSEADDKDDVLAGHLYIAPPDYHLLIEKDMSLTLDDSEKVNYSRPSIDVTFESGAALGKNALFVLLSGANADGVAGMVTARRHGGFTVVQDPRWAEVPYMPEQALLSFSPDLVLRQENIQDLFTLPFFSS